MKKCVKVCPNCGSTSTGLYATDAGAWAFCKDCEFGKENPVLGGSFPEVELSKLDGFRKQLRMSKKK